MRTNRIECFGKLVYNIDGEYEIHNVADNTIINISFLLDKIYKNPCDKCKIKDPYRLKIKIMEGTKTLFNEDGNLLLMPILKNYYSYHVNGSDLGTVLFNSVGKTIDITIESNRLYDVVSDEFIIYKVH